MRPADQVGIGSIQLARGRSGARLARDDLRLVQPRSLLGDAGELGGELAVGQVRGLVADQAEGSGIPESGGATQGENDLVALRQVEQLGQTLAYGADDVLHASLAVGGAQDGCVVLDCLQLGWANLGRATAEAAIGGNELRGDGGQGVLVVGRCVHLSL